MAGKAYLVGAGPGDPGLITVKGLRCLQEATLVVYDRLADPRLLADLANDTEQIYVGKGPGDRAMEQDEINELIVARAKAGDVVVRLKGGDPFVFGRGGEEVQALADAGIPFEVVPGVTSAIAAPAYAGIPLTHRQMASSFTVVSGNEDPTKDASSVNWGALACTGGTLVILMGWGTADSIVATLVKSGMNPSTPAALVQWGTTPKQRTVTGTLETIIQLGKKSGLSSPVVAVIGDVVGLRDQGSWYEEGPLFGKRVLITRSRSQASTLSEMLSREGAEPLELPTIEISAMPDYSALDLALDSISTYDWVIFTSANAVSMFFERIMALGMDSRALGGVNIAAIGPATESSLEDHGIVPDLVPDVFLSQGLIEGLSAAGLGGKKVLLPRADIAGDELPQGLTNLGADVDDIQIYRTTVPEDSAENAKELLGSGKLDVATFTSSSTVVNLIGLLNGNQALLGDIHIGCIGPVTAATAKELGLKVDFVAPEHTIPGLVEALKAFYKREGED